MSDIEEQMLRAHWATQFAQFGMWPELIYPNKTYPKRSMVIYHWTGTGMDVTHTKCGKSLDDLNDGQLTRVPPKVKMCRECRRNSYARALQQDIEAMQRLLDEHPQVQSID